jgi:hypothetical protein
MRDFNHPRNKSSRRCEPSAAEAYWWGGERVVAMLSLSSPSVAPMLARAGAFPSWTSASAAGRFAAFSSPVVLIAAEEPSGLRSNSAERSWHAAG